MKVKKNLAEILRIDRSLRLLLGGMILDGLMIVSLLAVAML